MPEQLPATIGKYQVIGLLGRGGMGAVYKARDPVLDRLVAIKVLNSTLSGEDFQQRFYREARATAKLHHRNIVAIYDIGEQDGSLYQVMEYIEGSTLDQLIRSGPSMSLEQKLRTIVQVCEGLDHAHKHGFVHRDIKPGNVMVTRDGTAKLLDFGIAQMADSNLTQTGMLMGTVNYMSPEQAHGERVDARSDIFSTGAVLYQLLTGHTPFESDTLATTLMKLLREDVPPLGKYLLEYPPELEQILSRATARSIEQRYMSALQFANELNMLLMSAVLPYAIRPDLIPQPIAAERTTAELTPGTAAPSDNPPGPITSFLRRFLRESGSRTVPGLMPTRVLTEDANAAAAKPVPPATPDGGGFTMLFGPAPESHGPPKVRLTFLESADGFLMGKSVALSVMPFRIGRSASADLRLSGSHISQEHASIDWNGKSFVIADLGSTKRHLRKRPPGAGHANRALWGSNPFGQGYRFELLVGRDHRNS